jgi:hypothetical protein
MGNRARLRVLMQFKTGSSEFSLSAVDRQPKHKLKLEL